ncbi:hypothetical protein KJ909_03990 [Patescibacteria group bacterium]|nr:hypothetical protein [Patescibacteria group bacterium]
MTAERLGRLCLKMGMGVGQKEALRRLETYPTGSGEGEKSMTTHIFHYNDLDGWCSAAIVARYTWERMGEVPVRFHEMDYHKPFPFEVLQQGDEVYIVDFGPTNVAMHRLWVMDQEGFLEQVVWIDHHETSYDRASKEPWAAMEGTRVRAGNYSAAWLTWDYFYGNAAKPVPPVVELVSLWDTFKGADQPEVIHTKYGLEFRTEGRPTSLVWTALLTSPYSAEALDYLSGIQSEGQMIYQDTTWRARAQIQENGFLVEIDGLKALAVNMPKGTNSRLFEGVAKVDETVVILAPFYLVGSDKVVVSLYRNPKAKGDFNLARVAEKYGGGGHANAAGLAVVLEELGAVLRPVKEGRTLTFTDIPIPERTASEETDLADPGEE